MTGTGRRTGREPREMGDLMEHIAHELTEADLSTVSGGDFVLDALKGGTSVASPESNLFH
jgi:hypothetical protein